LTEGSRRPTVARMSRLDQEKDPEVLHQMIELQRKYIETLTEEIKKLTAALAEAKGDSTYQQMRLAALERHLAKLTKQVFGPSSEQRTTDAPGNASAEGDDKTRTTARRRSAGMVPTNSRSYPSSRWSTGSMRRTRCAPTAAGASTRWRGSTRSTTRSASSRCGS
jgi:hypothetical protein